MSKKQSKKHSWEAGKRKSPANKELQRYVDRLVKKFGTATALAEKIGMSVSAFSRAVNEEGTFSFENCIRLAYAFGDHPSVILRLAGKGEMAEMLDRLYAGEKIRLSERDREFFGLWKKITASNRNSLIDIGMGLVKGAMVLGNKAPKTFISHSAATGPSRETDRPTPPKSKRSNPSAELSTR